MLIWYKSYNLATKYVLRKKQAQTCVSLITHCICFNFFSIFYFNKQTITAFCIIHFNNFTSHFISFMTFSTSCSTHSYVLPSPQKSIPQKAQKSTLKQRSEHTYVGFKKKCLTVSNFAYLLEVVTILITGVLQACATEISFLL